MKYWRVQPVAASLMQRRDLLAAVIALTGRAYLTDREELLAQKGERSVRMFAWALTSDHAGLVAPGEQATFRALVQRRCRVHGLIASQSSLFSVKALELVAQTLISSGAELRPGESIVAVMVNEGREPAVPHCVVMCEADE